MIKKKKYVVAVVGATGAVGNEMIATLEQRDFLLKNSGSLPLNARRARPLNFRETRFLLRP